VSKIEGQSRSKGAYVREFEGRARKLQGNVQEIREAVVNGAASDGIAVSAFEKMKCIGIVDSHPTSSVAKDILILVNIEGKTYEIKLDDCLYLSSKWVVTGGIKWKGLRSHQ
jgi:hypothetical protein